MTRGELKEKWEQNKERLKIVGYGLGLIGVGIVLAKWDDYRRVYKFDETMPTSINIDYAEFRDKGKGLIIEQSAETMAGLRLHMDSFYDLEASRAIIEKMEEEYAKTYPGD